MMTIVAMMERIVIDDDPAIVKVVRIIADDVGNASHKQHHNDYRQYCHH